MVTSTPSRPEYLVAPPGWIPEDPNPFSEDGEYGGGWTCFCVRGDGGPTWYGAEANGLFVFRAAQELGDLSARIADFLRYENSYGRVPILSLPEAIDGRMVAERALSETPLPGKLRASDPRWVVHSTSAEARERIRADGALRAATDLAEDGIAVESLGFTQLGEPREYADYVVLGRLDSHAAEVVVASRQAGTIRDDPDLPYEPGVRIYFDNHAIIGAGLGVRDGIHTLKVHSRLPLEPYSRDSVSASNLEESGLRSPWTPRLFLREANGAFLQRVGAGVHRVGRGFDRAERRGNGGTHDEG